MVNFEILLRSIVHFSVLGTPLFEGSGVDRNSQNCQKSRLPINILFSIPPFWKGQKLGNFHEIS